MEKVALEFSSEASLLRKGIYQHFKGYYYHVLGVAFDEETHRELVIYQALYEDQKLWARPLNVFLESILINDQLVPRFRYIGEKLDHFSPSLNYES